MRNKAVVFALAAGLVAFVLGMLATSKGDVSAWGTAGVLIPAVVLATFCWASAERNVASVAGAIDAAIDRLAQAASGDLENRTPQEVGDCVPQLAVAMDALFAEQRRNLDAIEHLARYDTVTLLPNRAHFRSLCEQTLAGIADDGTAALLFVDLDRFKAVNDTLGHAQGDMLLKMVADRLRAVAVAVATPDGPATVVGRLAGDEFTMFLPNLPDGIDAVAFGDRVAAALSEPFVIAGREVSVSASIGIAEYPRHGATLTQLMRAADAAMYRAKASGRARVDRFDDTLANAIAARTILEDDLSAAIGRGEFGLVFQPQLHASGRIAGVEALLRWRHPDGMRSPAAFIERAEETGQIVAIGEWVTSEVARTIARWNAIGSGVRVAVNISPRQLLQPGFFHDLRARLAASGASPAALELEVTETLAMRCPPETLEAIALLRADGATVAIDDFGTGYSNLARLRELPVDRVKLDRTLVHDVAHRDEARAIVHAVISLIHGIGCTAVAEGIETAAQAEVLRIIGCDVLQGFAIAQPMDEPALLTWMAGRQPPAKASRAISR